MKAWYRESSLNNKFITEKITKESILWYSLLEIIIKDIKYRKSLIPHKFKPLSSSEIGMLNIEIEKRLKEVTALLMVLYRHVKDIDKILECDEVECESFHLSKHRFLFRQIDDALIHFFNLKFRIINSLNKSLQNI